MTRTSGSRMQHHPSLKAQRQRKARKELGELARRLRPFRGGARGLSMADDAVDVAPRVAQAPLQIVDALMHGFDAQRRIGAAVEVHDESGGGLAAAPRMHQR